MAECIHFTSSFHRQSMERVIIPDDDKEWIVREKWSVKFPKVIQKIIVKKREYFESYYYVDLVITLVFPKCDSKILKSERMASNNIEFLIHGTEYNCFKACSEIDGKKPSNLYQCKVILTPIFQFTNEIFRKPGKRTKIDLLEGLKKLSEDISLLINGEYSDMIVCCGDKQVKAHKNIFSVRSTLFKKLLHHAITDEEFEDNFEILSEIPFNDSTTSANADDFSIPKVKLKNVNSSVFDEFIDFIYSGRYKTFDIKRSKYLVVAARHYGICDLENKCIVYLNSKISTTTSGDIYNFACECNCEKLQNHVLEYVKNEIFRTKRRRNRPILMDGEEAHQDNGEEYEEEMTELEKMRWLEVMRQHPTYLQSIPEVKKNRKVRDAFLIPVPDINAFYSDDGTDNFSE